MMSSMGKSLKKENTRFDDSKSPKTIDFDIKKGHDEGKKQLGIFKIENDKFDDRDRGSQAVTDRPTSFKMEEGSNLIEAVLERVKP